MNSLLRPTTALYDAKPKIVLDVDLDQVQRLGDDKPWLVGMGDVHHTVYVVDEDGQLVGVFVADGPVELKVGPRW